MEAGSRPTAAAAAVCRGTESLQLPPPRSTLPRSSAVDEGSPVGTASSGTDLQSPPRRGHLGDPRSVQVGGTCGQPGVRAPTAAQPRLRGPELHRVTDIRCRPRHRGQGHRPELRAVHFTSAVAWPRGTVWPRLPLELCSGRGAASLLGLPQLQDRRPWAVPCAYLRGRPGPARSGEGRGLPPGALLPPAVPPARLRRRRSERAHCPSRVQRVIKHFNRQHWATASGGGAGAESRGSSRGYKAEVLY